MKLIKYNEVVYNVPTDIWEFSLEQYIDTYVLFRDGTEGLDFDIKLASICSTIPEDVVRSMGWVTFMDLAEQLTFAKGFDFPEPDEAKAFEGLDRGIKQPASFEFKGERYFFQPDYGDTKLSVVAEVERLLANRDLIEYFHFLLALICRREGEVFDVKTLDAKAKLMLGVPIKDVYHQLFFCADLGNESSVISRAFSKASPLMRKMIKDIMGKATLGIAIAESKSALLGDGTR